MPQGLKPLMAHRCHALGWDETQQGVRDRGACLAVPTPMRFARAGRITWAAIEICVFHSLL
jgi:hypothetical protein